MPDQPDIPSPPAASKVTRARAVTVEAADPAKPRRRAATVVAAEDDAPTVPVQAPAVASADADEPAAPATISVQQGGISEVTAGAVARADALFRTPIRPWSTIVP